MIVIRSTVKLNAKKFNEREIKIEIVNQYYIVPSCSAWRSAAAGGDGSYNYLDWFMKWHGNNERRSGL